VGDDRREVGIAYDDYDDATPSFTLSSSVVIQGSTTDASHTITLTADGVNRHYGTPGAGVVVDANGGGNEFDIRDSYVTVEWLEFVGAQGDNIAAIQVYGTDGDVSTNVVLQNLLIHAFGSGTEDGVSTVGIDLAGDNTSPGKSMIVRNTMIWDGDHYAIEGDGAPDTALIENVSVDGMSFRGIYAQESAITVRNTIVTSSPSGDFVAGTGSLSGSNTPRPSQRQLHERAAGPLPPVRTPTWTCTSGRGGRDRHGADLSASTPFDIDGRSGLAAWDRGRRVGAPRQCASCLLGGAGEAR
jgi:hypothetical protein